MAFNAGADITIGDGPKGEGREWPESTQAGSSTPPLRQIQKSRSSPSPLTGEGWGEGESVRYNHRRPARSIRAVRSRRICHCAGRQEGAPAFPACRPSMAFNAGANIAIGDGPKGEGREWPEGRGPGMARINPSGFVHAPSPPDTKKAPCGRGFVLQCRWFETGGYARLLPEPHPRAQRSGQPFGCPCPHTPQGRAEFATTAQQSTGDDSRWIFNLRILR